MCVRTTGQDVAREGVGRELGDCSFNYSPLLCSSSFQTESKAVHVVAV